MMNIDRKTSKLSSPKEDINQRITIEAEEAEKSSRLKKKRLKETENASDDCESKPSAERRIS
jgi:hypothetical protein